MAKGEGDVPGQLPVTASQDSAEGDVRSYAYHARTGNDRRVAGTVEASSTEEARSILTWMNLDVLDLSLSERELPALGRKRVDEDDLLAFNQQLAHIAQAGLPVERGLRLMANDLKRGRMAQALNAVADEVEKGRPLDEAFEAHRDRFPRLYGRLVEVGLKTNSLAGVMLNMNRHIDLMRQVRWVLWEASIYPALVLMTLMAVIAFISWVVVPEFALIYEDMTFGYYEEIRLPWMTGKLIQVAPYAGPVAAAIGGLILAGLLVARMPLGGGLRATAADALHTWPIVGRVVRYQQIARWCDASRLGVEAGLGLPESIDLASETIGSPDVRHDTEALKDVLEAGRPIDSLENTRVLPATLLGAMAMATRKQMLAGTLSTMASVYQQQAARKVATLRYVLTPMLLILTALLIGTTLLLLFLPLIQVLRWLSI